jgi:MFS family permease
MRVAEPSLDTTAAVRGTYASFIGCGVIGASFGSRIPQIKDHLHLTPGSLGLVLLAFAVGSLVTLPLSGAIVHRWGSRRTVIVMSILSAVALSALSFGYLVGVVPVALCLLVTGFAAGAWDPAMNVQGAAVEHRLGRSIMPRFHAGYSAGTVGGALIGVVMVALHVPVPVHLTLIGIVVAIVVPLEARAFLPESDPDGNPDEPRGTDPASSASSGAFNRWLEPRTLLVGFFVLAFAFTEGTGNDWTAVAMIDGYHVPAALGTLAFAIFLSGMTGARWFGPSLLDRYGRVVTLRSLAVVSVVGLLLFVFGHIAALAFVGAALWGIGASLGFPVGMSAAADDPTAAAGRVSVVATLGYCAFLGGPPLIGFLGNRFTVLHALTAVAVLLALSVVLAGALRPLRGSAGSTS